MDVYSRSRVLPAFNGAYQLPQVLKTANPCIIETPKDGGGNPRIGEYGSPQGFMKSMHKHKFSPKGKMKLGGGAPMNSTIFHARHQTITEASPQVKMQKYSSGLQTPSKQIMSRTGQGLIQSMEFPAASLKK